MRIIRFTVLALCFYLISPPALCQEPQEIAVIVHPGVPEENLDMKQVRRLLMGERQFWTSGLRVTLLVRAPVAHERAVLLKKVYKMSEAQFRQFWIGKVFRAETSAGPKIVYSNQMAAQLVQAIPGSLTFVDASAVPPGARVLKIDGKLPGDPGYPLH